jgi:hypothetical protein
MRLSSLRGIRARVRQWWSSARQRGAYRRQIRQALAEGREPVIVFTMAKSASTSVEVSLMQLPELAVFKAHRLHPARIRAYYRERRRLGERESYRFVDDLGLALYDEIVRSRVPARVVVLVREPIGRNFSAYFHILPVLWKRADVFARLTPAQMAEGFLPKGRHRVPLDWFDEEFRPVFGVDVFGTPFPHEQGFVRLEAGPHDVLVMRADLDDHRKAACLAEWLGRDAFEIVRMNEADEKHYAEQYAAARVALRLPASYLDEMLHSRYTRHFFSSDEIARLRARWGGAGTAAEAPALRPASPGAGS